jgi:hypothetical protein
VSVECGSIRRIGTRERRHPGSRQIALPLKDLIEVVVAQGSEGNRHRFHV